MGLLDLLFAKNHVDLTNDELRELMKEKENYQFVDVRTKQEYKHKRIKEFNKNVDYYKFGRNPEMLTRISKDKPVVVMCQTGSRSSATCNMLHKMGYEKIYNLRRGINGWNGPTTK